MATITPGDVVFGKNTTGGDEVQRWSKLPTHYDKVKEFATLAGNVVPTAPELPDPATALLCARLIMEEAMETVAALGVSLRLKPEFARSELLNFTDLCFEVTAQPNLVGVIDGACDTRVVSTFTMVMCGVHDGVPQELVDNNNLGKFTAPG